MSSLRVLSLFANVGISETYFEDINVNTVVANELLIERVNIYKHLYPSVKTICGDICEPDIYKSIIKESKKKQVNFILATPPCQGMSRAGQMKSDDPRNFLIIKVMEAFEDLKPDYMLIENVPQMLKTNILVNSEIVKITDFIVSKLNDEYDIKWGVYDASLYGTPQYRKRTIIRIFKKGLSWPDPETQEQITLQSTIGDLPSLESGEHSLDHPNHIALRHSPNHILWLSHTPTGHSAFKNEEIYQPRKNGRLIRGFKNTYARMSWNKPAPTLTMASGVISSQSNVHPGRLLENGLYSDARALTALELFRVMGLPDNWSLPLWVSPTSRLLRDIIGEGVPPKMMKAFIETLSKK